MTDVLEHQVPVFDPEPVDSATPAHGAIDARRVGIVVAIIGAVAMVIGMAVDGVEHALDPTLVQREGLFTLTNIGHALLLLGAGAVVTGLLLALVGPAIYRTGPHDVTAPGRRLVQLAAPLVLLALFVTVAVWGSNSSLAQGHSHDETVAAGDGHTHAAGATDVHQHPTTPYQPLDAATQTTLIGEMSRVRELTMQYPTVAAATAAGLRPVGQFSPGSGAHYLVPLDTVMKSLGGFDLDHPIIYLFSGNDPTSTVVGVMYYVMNVAVRTGRLRRTERRMARPSGAVSPVHADRYRSAAAHRRRRHRGAVRGLPREHVHGRDRLHGSCVVGTGLGEP